MARKKYSLRQARELRELPVIELLDGQEYQVKSGIHLSTNERLEIERLQTRMAEAQSEGPQSAEHDSESSEDDKMAVVFDVLCAITSIILDPAPSQEVLNEMTLEDFTWLQDVFLEVSTASTSKLSTGMERARTKATELAAEREAIEADQEGETT